MKRIAVVVYALALLLPLPFLFFPLLNTLNYEFSLAAAFFAYFLSGPLGFGLFRWAERRVSSASDIWLTLISYGSLALLPVIFFPLGEVLLNSLRVKNCDIFAGLNVYFFLIVPSALLGFTIGAFSAALPRRNWKKFLLLLIGFFLFASLLSFLEVYFGPRVSLHHLILGPLRFYALNPALNFASEAWNRLYSLFLTGFFLIASYWLLVLRKNREMLAVAGILMVFSTILVILPWFIASDKFGLTWGNRTLHSTLSVTLEEPPVILHYSPEAIEADEAEIFLSKSVYAGKRISRILSIEPKPVHIYLMTSSQKSELTGAQGVHFTKPWRRELFISDASSWELLKHELVHLFAAEFGPFPFRVPWNPGLTEGLAEAITHGYAERDEPHFYLAGAVQSRQNLDVERIVSLIGFFARPPFQSYAIAGSFLGFLIRSYSPESVKKIYRGEPFELAFGKPKEQLAEEWRNFLARLPVPPSAKAEGPTQYSTQFHPPFYLKICPREREKIQDQIYYSVTPAKPEQGRKIAEEFHRLEPYNTEWIQLIVQIEMKRKNFEEAKKWLSLLTQPDFPPSTQISAYEQIEELCGKMKDTECIIQSIEKMLPIPYPIKNFRKSLQLRLLKENKWEEYQLLQKPCSAEGREWILSHYAPENYPLLLVLLYCRTSVEKSVLADWEKYLEKHPEWTKEYAEWLLQRAQEKFRVNNWAEAEWYYQTSKKYLPREKIPIADEYLSVIQYLKEKHSQPSIRGS